MSILTDFQREVLQAISQSILRDYFYFTGGSALSEIYLQHRYSDDLDLFTEDRRNIGLAQEEMVKIAGKMKCKIDFVRTYPSFIQCFVSSSSEEIRIDFAQDSPFRLKPKYFYKPLSIYTDSELDISCNKLSALFERSDIKDFVDVYFIHRKIITIRELLPKAAQKHVGLNAYWLAQSFRYIEAWENLPRMIKPVTLAELREFFIEQINLLMAS